MGSRQFRYIDRRTPVERVRQERARLAEPWRCVNLDGRWRAGRSTFCAPCLAVRRREQARQRQIARRLRLRGELEGGVRQPSG
jgi:hypothetical protein